MLFYRFSVIFLLFISIVNSATFDNFKRSQAYSYSSYKDKKDIEFAKHLKQKFRAYVPLELKKQYNNEKPSSILLAIPDNNKLAGPVINIKLPIKKVIKEEDVIDKKKDEVKDISFDFFGSKLEFNIPGRLKNVKYYPKNQKGINNFFDSAASSKYENLVVDINNICKKLQLNDWAVYLLVNKISNHAFSNSDEAKLFSWFLFNKMFYNVKIGLVSKHIVLLYNIKGTVYSMPSYKFKDKMFYIISDYNKSKPFRIYSYTKDYNTLNKSFDFSLTKLPKLETDIRKKTLSFKYNAKQYEIEYPYNKNIIDFMKTYPQSSFETFFNAPLEDDTYESIVIALKKHIDGKQASWAINFLLSFVQNAFVYQVDNKQFGHDKVMFAQEVLYYDKSDSDDRAVLFSYLIKKIFGFSVVGVKYKDHMSTALYIPMKGDSVRVNSKKYIVADPSYVNATIGQSIPKYKSVKPELFIGVE